MSVLWVLAASAIAVPVFFNQPYLLQTLTNGWLAAVLALSLTLMSGTAGQISFGQAGLLAIGGYAFGAPGHQYGDAHDYLNSVSRPHCQRHRRVTGISRIDNVTLGGHARLRTVRPKWPVASPLAELVLALLRPQAVKLEEIRLCTEVREIISLFEERLLTHLDHPACSRSYTNRRRVEIARALALKPRLLLLDEPTAGMNPTETAEMQAPIVMLKARGLTILLIEHKLEMVMQLSDRIYVLDDGARIALSPPQKVRSDPAVVEAYLGHREVGQVDLSRTETSARSAGPK